MATINKRGNTFQIVVSLGLDVNGKKIRKTTTYKPPEHEIMKVYTALQKYFPSWVGYNMAKCGGCIRACTSMLEKKGGCMEGRFEKPLRTKKPWKLDR